MPTDTVATPATSTTPGTMGRDPAFSPTDSRVVPFEPPEGGAATNAVQAQNCGTELMQLFATMGVLGPADFVMLGGDRHGRFAPGRDLTPQQLYEHMRWREHEHLQALARQQAQGGGGGGGA